jgi:hypothetical protein
MRSSLLPSACWVFCDLVASMQDGLAEMCANLFVDADRVDVGLEDL